METSEVCIQFTGGKDSTLLAALMARQFERVHLLSFRHPLIVDLDKVPLNVGKLWLQYSKDKFLHTVIDNERLFRQLYAGHWLQDLWKYRTYAANNVCSACRLSMVVHTIIYCLRNEIAFVRDGANRTGFDLSQQVWALATLKRFYEEYNIDYDCPLYDTSRNDIELLKLGLSAEKPLILYRSQPLCRGGGEVHNIYFRCYFLPLYGREARRRRDLEWLQDKLDLCREYISENARSPNNVEKVVSASGQRSTAKSQLRTDNRDTVTS